MPFKISFTDTHSSKQKSFSILIVTNLKKNDNSSIHLSGQNLQNRRIWLLFTTLSKILLLCTIAVFRLRLSCPSNVALHSSVKFLLLSLNIFFHWVMFIWMFYFGCFHIFNQYRFVFFLTLVVFIRLDNGVSFDILVAFIYLTNGFSLFL